MDFLYFKDNNWELGNLDKDSLVPDNCALTLLEGDLRQKYFSNVVVTGGYQAGKVFD